MMRTSLVTSRDGLALHSGLGLSEAASGQIIDSIVHPLSGSPKLEYPSGLTALPV